MGPRRAVLLSFFTVLLGLTACEIVGPGAESNGPFLYVANQADASVTLIDLNDNRLATTVDLTASGFAATSSPHHVAVEADGSFWYVTLIKENRVAKFDRANTLVGQVEFEAPGMLALDRESRRMYVGHSMTALSAPATIGVIDRDSMTIRIIELPTQRIHAIAESNGKVFAGSLVNNQILEVNVVDGDQLVVQNVAGDVHSFVQFAIAPDGQKFVATGRQSGQVTLFDFERPRVRGFLGAVDVGAGPWHPVFSPDGAEVFIPNRLGNDVVILDAARDSVAARIAGDFSNPHGTAVSPDGRFLYVSNANLAAEGAEPQPGWISVIDTETREVTRRIDVGKQPAGIGVAAR